MSAAKRETAAKHNKYKALTNKNGGQGFYFAIRFLFIRLHCQWAADFVHCQCACHPNGGGGFCSVSLPEHRALLMLLQPWTECRPLA